MSNLVVNGVEMGYQVSHSHSANSDRDIEILTSIHENSRVIENGNYTLVVFVPDNEMIAYSPNQVKDAMDWVSENMDSLVLNPAGNLEFQFSM